MQTPDECTLSTPPRDAVDAFARVFDYAHRSRPGTAAPIVDDVACALANVRGPLSLYRQGTQLPDLPFFPENFRHPLLTLDSGLHPHYQQDGGGQFFHFLMYLNTTAQGGGMVSVIADIRHECEEGGGTPVDARLTTQGIDLGTAMQPRYDNGIPVYYIYSSQLAPLIDSTLRDPFTRELASHYHIIPSCFDVTEAERNSR